MVKTWRDSAGNVTRIKIHSYGTGTLVNQDEPTKTETGSSPQNITVDFRAETFTISGMQLHNNIPGEGRVAQDTGTITFPIEVIDPEAGEFTVDFETVLRSGGNILSSSTGARWSTEQNLSAQPGAGHRLDRCWSPARLQTRRGSGTRGMGLGPWRLALPALAA